jgi:ubiquinone/menaquinone biosynthesis C-methylase UbiE
MIQFARFPSLGPISLILRVVIALGGVVYMLRQVRKPSRWFGRGVVTMMNATHSALTDWGLEKVRIDKHFILLDVGCGGGRTIKKLAALATEGKVFGVDYSKGSIAVSRANNADLIAKGRVQLFEASVSKLPFSADEFDLITAIETHYYWPSPVEDMEEILRVLIPGGTLILIAESYRKVFSNKLLQWLSNRLTFGTLTAAQHGELFANAGYTAIQVVEDRSRGWICALGTKPVV